VGGGITDEAELIARSQKGNVSAFNQLVLSYQELVYNVALRILGDPEAAADATQEAFLSAFQSVGGFRGGSFKVWLLRIVTNGCYDYLRARKRRPTESLEDIVVEGEESGPSLASSFESPEDHALRMDLQAEVQRCLRLLPLEQRVTLVLSDVHGLSYEEIASVTKSSLGTVKSRLSRARAGMRDLLRQRELLPSTERL
jgi:RNA polymerase sigma-70 factor, ECF subfamily